MPESIVLGGGHNNAYDMQRHRYSHLGQRGGIIEEEFAGKHRADLYMQILRGLGCNIQFHVAAVDLRQPPAQKSYTRGNLLYRTTNKLHLVIFVAVDTLALDGNLGPAIHKLSQIILHLLVELLLNRLERYTRYQRSRTIDRNKTYRGR